jgi:Meckel syndrome type 1 protein
MAASCQDRDHFAPKGTAAGAPRLFPERNHSQEEVMAVLNLSANEPYIAPTTSADSSPLFPDAPVYARTPANKSSSNLPLLIGLPVLAVAAGGLAWGLMGQPAQTPTTDEAPAAQVAEVTPAPVAQTPAPMPTPAPAAAMPAAATPAPTQVARAETAPPPRVTTPAKRAAPARRAAPETAPDAGSASENVSATVPAPVAAPAPTPVIAAPAASAPVPAPAPTPAPAPVPATPDAPM